MEDPQSFIQGLQLTVDALGYLITVETALLVILPLLQKYLPDQMRSKSIRAILSAILISLFFAIFDLGMLASIPLASSPFENLYPDAEELILFFVGIPFAFFAFIIVVLLISTWESAKKHDREDYSEVDMIIKMLRKQLQDDKNDNDD